MTWLKLPRSISTGRITSSCGLEEPQRPAFTVNWVAPGGPFRRAVRLTIAGGEGDSLAVAFDGQTHFVVWTTGGRVRGVRVSKTGQVLDSAPLNLTDSSVAQSEPCRRVRWNAVRRRLDRIGGHERRTDRRGARKPTGDILDAPAIRIADGAIAHPAIASDGAVSMIVWTECGAVGDDRRVVAARLNHAGEVLASGGAAIGNEIDLETGPGEIVVDARRPFAARRTCS